MIKIIIATVLVIYACAFLINIRQISKNIFAGRRELSAYRFAWILMFYGVAMFFYREGRVTGLGSMDVSSSYQVICIGVGGLITLFLMLKYSAVGYLGLYPINLLFLYGVLGVMSGSYSPAPAVSVYKGILVLVDAALLVVGVRLLKSMIDMKALFDLTFIMVSLLSLGALVGSFVHPEQAYRYLYNAGVFGFVFEGTIPYMNANELGFLGGVTAIVGYRRMFEVESSVCWRMFWLAQLLVGLVVLVLAQARTSLATFMLAVIILGFVIPRLRKLALLSLPILVLLGGYLVVSSGGEAVSGTASAYLQRGQDAGGLQSLKGRYHMWTTLGFNIISDSPILGLGFDAGTRYGAEDFGTGEMHMHNSHIQVLSNSGMLGYLCWLPIMLFVILRLFRFLRQKCAPALNMNARFHAELTVVAMMIFLRTFTGSVVVIHSWSMMIIIAMIIYLLGLRRFHASEIEDNLRSLEKPKISRFANHELLSKK